MKQSYIKIIVLLLTIITISSGSALSQIQLIPTTIVLDRAGVGTVMVVNTADEPREISISTEFRYNVSNESGQSIEPENFEELKKYDISDDLLIYPPRFVLGGGERRDIRIQHRITSEVEDGGYFSRFIVRAEPTARDIVQEENPESIGVQLNYIFVQDIPLYHFYGNTTTGIEVLQARMEHPEDDPEQITFIFDMDKTGNSPYRGRASVEIINEEGEIIHEFTQQIGLFTDRAIAINTPKEHFKPGVEYVASFTFETKRRTSNPAELVQGEDVEYELPFTIKE